MKTEILGVILQIVLMVGLAWPLGKYIARVYKGEKTCLDFMKPVERWMYKLSGVNPDEKMDCPESAILSAVIFNALIIPLLIPLALRGVAYKPIDARALLRRNLLIYGVGGIIAPFVSIKLIDLLIGLFF